LNVQIIINARLDTKRAGGHYYRIISGVIFKKAAKDNPVDVGFTLLTI
jgi:hypothetical protein